MIRVDLNADNFINQPNREEAMRSMKRDRDLDLMKESLLRRKEAQHRKEQALAEEKRLIVEYEETWLHHIWRDIASDWGDIEIRRRHIEANWRDRSIKRKTLRLREFTLREDERDVQRQAYYERIDLFHKNTESFLRETGSEFPDIRTLRQQYIDAALESLCIDNSLSIEQATVKNWLGDLVVGRKITLRAPLPRPLNIKGQVRREVMGKVVHFLGIGVLCFSTTYSSFFLLKEFDHRVWGADGMKLEPYFVAPMSCLLSCLVCKLRASVWNPWERIKEKFMECAKERCISWIKEKAGRVIQVEFKESSKEVCMIRACRIMQEACPAIQEALQGIKAHQQKLLVIHRPKKDLIHSKKALQSMHKALRPVNKALRSLVPFITSANDQKALNKRWRQSCISEAHRLLDKSWDFKLMSYLFSKERIKQAQIELLEKAYHLISKTSGLFPIEKELLFRIQEIDQALSETDYFRKLALLPIQQVDYRMCEFNNQGRGFLRRGQKNPKSLQKRCVETIYLHGLDHGLECDVQDQIDELFQDVCMPAKQEMINLHNYVFMGWSNSA